MYGAAVYLVSSRLPGMTILRMSTLSPSFWVTRITFQYCVSLFTFLYISPGTWEMQRFIEMHTKIQSLFNSNELLKSIVGILQHSIRQLYCNLFKWSL